MKANKKIAAATALALSALSITPMTSGAVFTHSDMADAIEGWVDGWTKVDSKYNHLLNSSEADDDDVVIYMNSDGSCARTVYELNAVQTLYIPADGVTREQINEVLKENFEATPVGTPADTWYEYPTALNQTEEVDGKVYKAIKYVGGRSKEIGRVLKENGLVSDFIIRNGFYGVSDLWFDHGQILSFYTNVGSEEVSETIKQVADYVVENNIAVPKYYYSKDSVSEPVDTFEESTYMILETPEEMSLEEQLDISADLKERFEVGIGGASPDVFQYCGGKTIDLYNAVDGDANNDGELDIADATLVLQSIGNADKYALSAQGEYNADVDCSGGITALDALEIQKMDAGLR